MTCANVFYNCLCSCKNALYLSDGTCVATCPVGTSAEGAGNFGRRCQAIPPATTNVVCASKTVVGFNTTCTCNPLSDCHTCTAVAGVGNTVFGVTCQQCKNSAALLNGQCVKTCPAGFAMTGAGLHRRRCERILTCRGRLTVEDSTTCTCNSLADCHECQTVLGQATQCMVCKNGQFLDPVTKTCEDSCPDGYLEGGLGDFNLRCDLA